MTSIITRQTLRSNVNDVARILTPLEMDSNLINLNAGKLDQTGYRPSVAPTLNLDFTKRTLDPRVTFTRASTGSYYDGKTTALAEQNLLAYSQQFDNAYWNKYQCTITPNSIAAPDGTVTGGVFTSTNTVAGTYKQIFNTNTLYSVSCYFKAGTSQYPVMSMGNDGSAYAIAIFDVIGISVTQTLLSNANIISTSIVSVGSGWCLCKMTFMLTAGSSPQNLKFEMAPAGTGNVSDINGDIPGNTIGYYYYIWGAQLEQRSSATAYTPTTSSAISNYIPVLKYAPVNIPRLAYDPVTGKSQGLLVEQQSTNLLTNSSNFSSSWTPSNNVAIYSNTNIAPDGTLTASTITNNFGYSTPLWITRAVSNVGSASTFTIYAKANTQTILGIHENNTYNQIGYFDLLNGTATKTNGSSNVTVSISPVGGGWWRCVSTRTDANSWQICIYGGNGAFGAGWSAGTSLYIWGAQLEAGSIATSYIPTTSSQVTRAADSAKVVGTNFTNFYNQSEGTFAVSRKLLGSQTNQTLFSVDNGTTDIKARNTTATNVKNLLTYSEQFDNSAWSKVTVNATANSAMSPDGSFTADLISETISNGSHQIQQPSSLLSTSYGTASVYVKPAGRTKVSLTIPSADFNGNYNAVFDVSAGSIISKSSSGTATLSTASISQIGNGWFRLQVSGIASTTSTTTRLHIAFGTDNSGSNSYAGDGVSGIYIWGAQLEVGTAATTYEPNPRYTPFEVGSSYVQSGSPLPLNEKESFSYTASTMAASINNSIPTSLAASPVIGMNQLTIGDSSLNPGRTLNGTIQNFRYYPKAQSPYTLYALTAPADSYFNLENGYDLLLMEDGSSKLTAEWST